MSKTDKRRKRNREKFEAMVGLPELAEVPRKQPNGQIRRTPDARDKSLGNLKVRCRQMGIEVTHKNIRTMREPWWGCYAGRVIAEHVMQSDDRAALWDAIMEMRKITAAYDRSVQAPMRHPACMRLLAVSGKEGEPEPPKVEDRTPEETARLAQSRWMAMHGWLGYTDKAAASEAMRVVVDDEACVDKEGLLSALRCVSDGIQGKKDIKYRGRS